ncbi:MAG: hypothetical protein AB7U83_15395 [Vicinamibacterales bacterium]
MAAPYAVGRTRTAPSRLRRVLRRLLHLGVAAVVAVLVALVAFVSTRCYGGQLYAGHAPGPPGLPRYLRAEAFTFLTLPEWYIVYSADEYAQFIRRSPPSAFPYLSAIGQYWGAYGAACDATRGRYPFETGYHVMLGVIGLSLTGEYGLKAVYENTVGRATELLFSTDTPEDVFAAGVAVEYGRFLHTTPWYEFPFGEKLQALWADVPWWGPRAGRKWERRLALSLELGVKAAYGAVMGMGSQAAYGAEDLTTYGRILRVNAAALAAAGGRLVPSKDPVPVVALPRYEAFTPAVLALAMRGQRFQDIAGNDDIVVGLRAPTDADVPLPSGASIVLRQRLLTTPGRDRVAVMVPVLRLHEALAAWATDTLAVEHVYDY